MADADHVNAEIALPEVSLDQSFSLPKLSGADNLFSITPPSWSDGMPFPNTGGFRN
jgi:hypothetical protein